MLGSVLWCGVDLGLECGRPEMEIILRRMISGFDGCVVHGFRVFVASADA